MEIIKWLCSRPLKGQAIKMQPQPPIHALTVEWLRENKTKPSVNSL